MTPKQIREHLINSGVKNLNEWGYPKANPENILTDGVHKMFFKSMLENNIGSDLQYDLVIYKLLSEIDNTSTSELDQLKLDEIELMKSLSNNRERQRQINTDAFFNTFKANIGYTIEFVCNDVNFKGVVSHFQYFDLLIEFVLVYIFKPNGILGKRKMRIPANDFYSIKVISKAE